MLSHTSSLDVPKLLFALLQLLLSAGVSGRPFDILFVASRPLSRSSGDFLVAALSCKVVAFQVSLISVVVIPESSASLPECQVISACLKTSANYNVRTC